jgi:hypothetical protein
VRARSKKLFDEVVAVKGRFKKDDVKKQYADYTPTINTQVNIIKNKIPTCSPIGAGSWRLM